MDIFFYMEEMNTSVGYAFYINRKQPTIHIKLKSILYYRF
jgi:hypothetical protein